MSPTLMLKLASEMAADYGSYLDSPKYFGRKGSVVNSSMLLEAARANQIDPRLLASIIANESGWGTHPNAVKSNNFGGVMGAGSELTKYPTPAAGLHAVAANLHKRYVSQGLTTPEAIGPKYAPTVKATNDPQGMNNQWIPTVNSIMKRIPEPAAAAPVAPKPVLVKGTMQPQVIKGRRMDSSGVPNRTTLLKAQAPMPLTSQPPIQPSSPLAKTSANNDWRKQAALPTTPGIVKQADAWNPNVPCDPSSLNLPAIEMPVNEKGEPTDALGSGLTFREWVDQACAPKAKVAEKQASVVELLPQARAATDTNPTEAQLEAGNYAKGELKLRGHTIKIENPKGSIRRGTDKSGKKWEQVMQTDYGYIKSLPNSKADGDKLDVLIGPDPEHGKMFIIDQVDSDGQYDEPKICLGYADEKSARAGYLANYSKGWKGLGNITEVSDEELSRWAKEGDTGRAYKAPGARAEKNAGVSIIKGGQTIMAKNAKILRILLG